MVKNAFSTNVYEHIRLRVLRFLSSTKILEVWGSVVVKALRYYSDCPRINCRWCHWIFQWHISFRPTMTLGSTQTLVEMSTMSTRNIPGGKGVRCMRLTTSPPSRAECHEIWEPKPPGTLWATQGLLGTALTLRLFLVLRTL